MIEIICATRLSETDFWKNSALGFSLRRFRRDDRFVAHLAYENQRPLPDIYNARILAPDSRDLLIFMHDDVWIDDFFLADRLIQGFERYDVIGIVGNRRRAPYQTSWVFLNVELTWDDYANLSGAIAHGTHPFGQISRYGPAPADCELLDGVFLAAKKSVLTANSLRFDPQFDFHFYDLDFCRSARQRGMRLGTWPICLTHQSGGAFGTERWKEKYRAYIAKWGS